MFSLLSILKNHGKQYIPSISSPVLPDVFRGLPVIEKIDCEKNCTLCLDECPTDAISLTDNKVSLDIGNCLFCNECQTICPSKKIKFTNNYKIASNTREALIIKEGLSLFEGVNPEKIRKEIIKVLGHSLKLRQISAGGDNADENELNACTNVNFDMGRFGIDWVASPRHADGIVISGAISENMAEAVQICYDAVPFPKVIILAGTSAISGGIYKDSPALKRDFLSKYPIDLYVPGHPIHPLTFINGVLEMLGQHKFKK